MLFYLCLFLFGINFMLWGNAFLAIPFGMTLVKKKRIKVNITTVILIVFVVAYLIPEFASGQRATIRLIFLPIAFLLGYNYYDDIDEKDILTSYLVIAVGMATHVILSIVLTMSQNGIKTGYTAVYTDIWSRTITSTTGLMSNFVLFLPVFVFALSKGGKYYTFISFSLLGVLFSVMTGNRSTLVLFVVATIVGVLISLFSKQRKSAFIMIVFIALLVMFVVLAYQFNWLGIRGIYDNSYMSYRLSFNKANDASLLDSGRWEAKGMYISKMLDYPWGGGALREEVGIYAHDIWLDTWSSGGCIAFTALVIYLAGFIYRMIKFILAVNDISIKILFASFSVVLFMQFFVEPVLNGAPWLFISANLFDGMIAKYLSQEKTYSVR